MTSGKTWSAEKEVPFGLGGIALHPNASDVGKRRGIRPAPDYE